MRDSGPKQGIHKVLAGMPPLAGLPGGPPPRLIMLAAEISKLCHDRMRRESERIGVKSGYRHLLMHIARIDGITQQELVRITHLKAPTISVTLQNMEQDGLITRQPDGQDARQMHVHLTEEGRRLDMLLRDVHDRVEDIFMQGIGEEEGRQALEVLLRMRNNILIESGVLGREAD
nr:MarR family winged helix-turn-helix transcriptional regulator [bacterium]